MTRTSNAPPQKTRTWVRLAAIICTLLGPVQSAIWNGAQAPGWIAALASFLGFDALGDGASTFDQPPAIYFEAGQLLILVYAILLMSLWRSPLDTSDTSTAHKMLARMFGLSLAIAGFGDALAYGFSASLGPAVRDLGFWQIEVPALVLALLFGMAIGVHGLRTRGWRSPRFGRLGDFTLSMGLPFAAVALAGLRYMPHSLLLPIVWAVALKGIDEMPKIDGIAERRSKPWLGCAVIVIALIALVAVALPYRPIHITGPVVAASSFPLSPPLANLRVHIFNTGANRMSSLLVGPRRPWRAVPAFLIEHPTRGLIAFDLGLSKDVAEHGEAAIAPPVGWLMESRGRIGFTMDAQMKKAGFSPSHVGTVVISHLHEDHTGVADDFQHAEFIGGADTRIRMLEGEHSPWPSRASPAWREIEFNAGGRALGPFDKSVDLFGDGSIWIIGGGGHTSEDLMALVNLPAGPALLTGDVVVHHDWLDSTDVERIASDPERAAELRNQIRMLRDSGAILVIPGHDLRRLGSAREDIILHDPERFTPDAWPIQSRSPSQSN